MIGQTVRVMPISSRRTFLGAMVVAVAAGAGAAADFALHPRSPRARRSTADRVTTAAATHTRRVPVLELALARERALLADLAHAATTTPTLAAKIAVLRADHGAHAAALVALITAAGGTPRRDPAGSAATSAGTSSAATSSAATSSAATSSAASSAGRLASARVTLADLVRWEKAAGAGYATDFATATGAEAAVLASMCASEQTHAAWLS